MEIVYCDTCGKRIRSGEEQRKTEGGAMCFACANKPVEAKPVEAAAGALTKSGTLVQQRPASSTRQPLMHDSSAEMLKPDPRTINRRSALLSKPGKPPQAPNASGGNKSTVIAVLAGAAVLLVVVGVILAGGSSKPETRTARKQEDRAEAKTVSTPAPSPATPVAAPQRVEKTPPAAPPKTDEPSVGDIRESYARRVLDEMIQKEKAKTLSAFQFRKDLQGFVASYASTKAGKEGAELLKTLPEVEPPPETKPPVVTGDSKVVYFSAFETDEDMQSWGDGTKTAENPFGGAGTSLRLGPMSNNWFSAGTRYGGGWSGKHLPISPNAWVRFAYRFDKGNNFCVQIQEGTNFWQKHVFDLPQGKWQYYTIKFAEMENMTKDGPKAPPEGATVKAIMLFGGKDGVPITLTIDQMTLGDGPIPEEPKIP
ncbi:MAG: hypothetical protein KIS92_15110 [Planctomycetota bacterium]|nr:hypothetical protein [Planctomycetota bacterium]